MPKHERPTELLNFVAKTGFITRDLWLEFFFKGGSERWAYQSWRNLHDAGYLTPHPTGCLKDVSILDLKRCPRGEWFYGKPVKPTFIDFIEHDLHLYRGILHLERCGLVRFWETEGKIKSRLGQEFGYNPHEYKNAKYPDVLVDLPNADRPWAVEMELSRKSTERYCRAMNAYASMKDVGGVVFVHKKDVIKNAILRAIKTTYFPLDETPVAFISLENWQTTPSQSFRNVVGPLCRHPANAA
ncbi:MAG: hypothetical protein KF767_11665 [Bdellovibrionaceae bacterium]|nr:hypothetical protein [Pseudobdellovibrionaceae bacterium]